MGTLTRHVQRGCAAALAAVALAGCGQTVTVPGPQQDTNALLGIKEGWLTHCDELAPRQGDAVADLQGDYDALAYVAGLCASNHGALVDYLLPHVRRAQEAAIQAGGLGQK